MSGRVFRMTLAVAGALAMIGTAEASALPSVHRPLYQPKALSAPEPQPQYGKGGPNNPDPLANGFGERIRTVGDIDGDGASDLLISQVNFAQDGLDGVGRQWIFSGRTLRLLRTVSAPVPQKGSKFGFWSAALGDVNGDKVPDFVTSSDGQTVGPNQTTGQVYVISGRDARPLYTVDNPDPQPKADFGGNVIAPGDLDGDGIKDFVVTASRVANGAGRAYAFSGKDGHLLYRVDNPDAQASSFGFGGAELGDVDNDGVADYQIGAPFYNVGPVTKVGRAYVFSGKTGAKLYTLDSPDREGGARFGQADADGAAIGDITGDGVADIYVDGFLSTPGPNLDAGGRAFLFSGKTGRFFARVDDPMPVSGGQFASSDAPAGDLDNDGRPDVLVGATPHHAVGGDNANTGSAVVLGGRDLKQVLVRFKNPRNQQNAIFGNSVASPGDVNGDGHPDYFVGARSMDVNGQPNVGEVWAYMSKDVTRPRRPTISGPRRTSDTSPTFRATSSDFDNADDELLYYCAFDSHRLQRCSSRFTQRLKPGRHLVRVQVRDPAGNRSTISRRHVTITS